MMEKDAILAFCMLCQFSTYMELLIERTSEKCNLTPAV